MAFLFNLDLSEIAIIAIGAIIVFGKNLPQVAMRGAAQFMRLRRQLTQMWREAGLEEEMRKVRRDLESSVPKLPPAGSFFDPADSTPGGEHLSDLARAGESELLEPDEDPDERADWEREDAYGPSEEQMRAVEQQVQEQAQEPEPKAAPKDESA